MNLLGLFATLAIIVYTNEPHPLPLNAGMVPTNRFAIIPPRVRLEEVNLPLPDGGFQNFKVFVRRPMRIAEASQQPVSLAVVCPVQANSYRLDVSTDLTNWIPQSASPAGIVIVFECEPKNQKFWRLVPISGP